MDPKSGPSVNQTKQKKVWLYRYILSLATIVFCGRAMPLAFIPIALTADFGASDQTMGMTLAVYPLLALASTPVVSRIALGTTRIVRLHTFAIWGLALSMLISSLATYAHSVAGTTGAVTCIIVSRASQGIGVSLYLSANTSLITRMFSEDIEYTIAMLEVMSGIGSQLGRIVGGFLYDLGGFTLPFIVIASMQLIGGALGLFFDESPAQNSNTQGGAAVKSKTETDHAGIRWKEILTLRMVVGALGPFFAYYASGLYDALLPRHLEDHLGPIPMSAVSSVMSARSLSYMTSSYLLAKILEKKLVSFEVLMILGSLFGFSACLLMAPEPFLLSWVFGDSPPRGLEWFVQVVAFVFQAMGTAFLFVPSLPLMQSEARTYGSQAVEKTAELFVFGMTAGEMMGPIVAGSLSGTWTFVQITTFLAILFVPYAIFAALSYDAKVVRQRMRPDVVVALDGDVNFAVRRLPFALAEKRQDNIPWTAPASSFRRRYGDDGGSDSTTGKNRRWSWSAKQSSQPLLPTT